MPTAWRGHAVFTTADMATPSSGHGTRGCFGSAVFPELAAVAYMAD